VEDKLIQVTPGELDGHTALLIGQDSPQETAAIDVALSALTLLKAEVKRNAYAKQAPLSSL
jgi:hypothetical protein